MPNQYIIDYLKQNKDKFSFETLKEKLLKAGYSLAQIEEARKIVYEIKEEKVRVAPMLKPKEVTSFWDFSHKKVYTSGKEKILDFIIGFLSTIMLKFLLDICFLNLLLRSEVFYYFILNLVIYLILIIYFLLKRKYIALGIICYFLFSFLRILIFYLENFILNIFDIIK